MGVDMICYACPAFSGFDMLLLGLSFDHCALALVILPYQS